MYCARLSETAPIDTIGGKAANLARVLALGMRVPETVVLECQALRDTLQAHHLEAPLREYLGAFGRHDSSRSASTHREITSSLCVAGLPPLVSQEVRASVGRLLASAPCGLAVRSSSVYEDSPTASFAGVFESWLGVTDLATLERRILECWCSSWAPRALRYLDRMGIAPRADGMAVMIQPVVPATASGVIYTADPDSGDPREFVVRAARGLSVDLLSGRGVGDMYRVEWDTGTLVRREEVAKPSWDEATSAGVQRHQLRGPESTRSALRDTEVSAIAEQARRLDEAFSSRLDIEFVFAPNGLWIVQARPLTALPSFFPDSLSDEDRARPWQRQPFVVPLRRDLPPGFLTPLYSDLSDAELWFRYQPDDIVLTVFCKETRDVNGYRYTATDPLPMFTDYFEDPSGYEAWLDTNEPRYRERWDRHADEVRQLADVAQSALRDSRSAADLIPTMLQVRDRLWDLNAFGWSGPQSLGWMCAMLLNHFVKTVDPELDGAPAVGGGTDSYMFEVTRALQELGRSTAEPEVRLAFETLRLDQIVPHLRQAHPDSEFLRAFEALCWQYGKTPPSWRGRPGFWNLGEDEAAMMHTIRCAHRGVSRDVHQALQTSRETRDRHERQLRDRIAALEPGLLPRFAKILAWARYWGQALNDRHGVSAGLLWERELVWHVGRRMTQERILDGPEDVLALRREDLEAFAGGADPVVFRGLVNERRREMLGHLRLQAPDTIGAVPPPAPTTTATDTMERPTETDRLVGRGIGSSNATGVARNVVDLTDPALLDVLGPEDVLVLPNEYAFHYADWHSLLMLVKGVISPGQPSHHLAQVARECGVAVIGHVAGDLDRIADGTRLHLDARSGVVRLLE